MKINEPSRIGNVNPYRKQQDSSLLNTSKAKGKQKDQVQISAEAKELQELGSAGSAQAAQELRNGKIDDLKKAVSTNTYHVESGKIAEKLWPYIK